MLGNSSAAAEVPWWYMLFLAVILVGILMWVWGEAVHFLKWFGTQVGILLSPRTYQTVYVSVKAAEGPDGETRDPTRPRAWDDVEGKTTVAERMRLLDPPK